MSKGSVSKLLGMIFAATLTAGCASAGQEDAPAATPEPDVEAMVATPEMVDQGAQLFAGAGRCSVCHGDGGVGGRFGPDLTDDEWAWIDPASPTALQDTAELIRTGITEPRVSDAGMPPMGGANLTDDQLYALAAYVLSL